MSRLLEIFLFFVKLGTFSFGGPTAHIKVLENELVKKQQRISQDRYKQLTEDTVNLPGADSIKLMMRVGYELNGVGGMILAGLGYILPGSLLMLIAGLYYKELAQLPLVKPFLYGIKGSVIAILLYTAIMHGLKYFRDIRLLLVFLVVAGATFIRINPILLLGLSAILMLILNQTQSKEKTASLLFLLQTQAPNIIPVIDHPKLLTTFIKIGFLIFGSGYMIVAYSKMFLVDHNILSAEVLMDAVAISLFAPGPLISLATFLGFQINEWHGALYATLGYLLPILLYTLISKFSFGGLFKTSSWNLAMKGLAAASLGILLAVSIILGYETYNDTKLWLVTLLSLLILFRWRKLNPVWLVIISANLGYLILHFFPGD